jgi:membrane-associated protease RseP (regulator of RpoE activity)
VSSRDISPAPYSLYEAYRLSAFRPRDRYWLHLLLLFLTLLTTTTVGAALQYSFNHNVPFDLERSIDLYSLFWQHPAQLLGGLPFSLTLLAILLAHEFGHYLAALYHGVDCSLPYFLPSPVLGTFGAFIRIRSPIYSKRVLFDIGVAGPLAGFVFLLPALAIGLAFSKVIPGIGHQGDLRFGISGLEWILESAIFPAVQAGNTYLHPLSSNIYLHPVARAAWVGMLTTALNLLPIGQLDGGHILYAFFPRRHKLVSIAVCVCVIPLGVFWHGWCFWGVVLLILGRRHPSIYDAADLGAGRRKLAWIALVIFLLCFTYVPFIDTTL